MNLLHDPWMPVRDDSGARQWITPDRLSEPQWRSFDADRPDFNGALAQFAIGLLQTTTPAANSIEWRRWFSTPPDTVTLQRWFEPVAEAFVLDGDGARFMQDFDLGSEGVAINGIGAILIEAPGEQTVKKNADLFVKRDQINALCEACATLALFTLQLNAPAGGAGHRTGLRGGGPLTTLVLAPGAAPLWRHLWLNVRDRAAFLNQGGDNEQSEPQRSFPWLGPIGALQAPTPQGQLAQSQVHPAHLYWAMPRRIRLNVDARKVGICDCCGRSGQRLIGCYATKNYGLNYKGTWSHPLSPYYETKEGWLPVHPQPDGLGYRHWMAWVLGAQNDKQATRVASVVERALSLPRQVLEGPLQLWAFGFDMDNMKARCWYESALPMYTLTECSADARKGVQAEVGRWLAAAELAASYLRGAVKNAWFAGDSRGDFGHVDASFWNSTEPTFYRQLQTLIEANGRAVEQSAMPARETWHRLLVRSVLHLFDEAFVGTGAIERQNPRRTALAHKQLRANLHGRKLRNALGLPVEVSPLKPARKVAGRTAKESA